MKKLRSVRAHPRPRLRNRKAKGEWAELVFMAKALTLGLTVCRPYGDNDPFDFLVFRPGQKISRVQVKSSWSIHHGMYTVNTHACNNRRYRPSEVDFIVVYVVPLDVWYIIPVRRLFKPRIYLSPHLRHSRSCFERYREAWHLLQVPGPGRRIASRFGRSSRALRRNPSSLSERSGQLFRTSYRRLI